MSSGASVQSARSDFGRAAAMGVRSVSDGGHLGIKYPLGYDAPGSWWLSAESWPNFPMMDWSDGEAAACRALATWWRTVGPQSYSHVELPPAL